MDKSQLGGDVSRSYINSAGRGDMHGLPPMYPYDNRVMRTRDSYTP
jgi:hypothetical protein